MARYVKKPYVVEAIRFVKNDFEHWSPWAQEAYSEGKLKYIYDITGTPMGFTIKTLEGEMRGHRGYYLVKGVENELYPCRGDIFEKTYEKVSD